ncbi:oxygenase MpaB family protein [Patulibacter brassicae]|jgi:uncharacterized protein (DUF2236 family)|uniref:Oxygenase MpaB family protein n=1 Tax=Patulibacter brassicae TaxID=1705717 RepID=A0ABU4VLA4_9ACTN|nr:oxygenase MpaB family protein [Patulibacter brassicae]MDX8152636.1 oxygenase MpaB family protein [Patulibacter brassicae]
MDGRSPLAAPHASPDGLFDDHAMIRRVHRERLVMLHGPRALLLQAAHPLAFRGFWSATEVQETALAQARLRRTAEAMATAVFGSASDAERMGERIRAVHARIGGRLSEAAGPWPAGTRWRADDPELLLWILAALVDSAMLVHDRFVRPLRPEERAAFWRDYRVVGELFGLDSSAVPRTIGAFDAYVAETLASDRMVVLPEAREAARRIVLDPPVPPALRPAVEVANLVTATLLPRGLRRAFGLRTPPGTGLATGALATWSRHVLRPVLPTGLAWTPHGSPAPLAA